MTKNPPPSQPGRLTVTAAFLITGLAVSIGTNIVLPPAANDNHPAPHGGPQHFITPGTKLSSLNETERKHLLDAMQRQEGWRPGTTSYRGNNPGNLNQGAFARAHGSIGDIHGIAVFPTYEKGRSAMKDLVFGIYGDRTIFGMLAGDPTLGIKGYAPAVVDQFGHRGNPRLYAQHVATWMNEMAAQHSDKLSPASAWPPLSGSSLEHAPGHARAGRRLAE